MFIVARTKNHRRSKSDHGNRVTIAGSSKGSLGEGEVDELSSSDWLDEDDDSIPPKSKSMYS